jgi:hypothetical protein
VPLSIEVSVERIVGTCGCGIHGALSSIVVHAGEATDKTKPICPACQETETHKLVLMTPESKIPRAPSRRVKHLSQKQEREVMAELGGRVMPASGSKPGYKGDGRVFDVARVEMKEVFSKTFNLTRDILNKIRGECSGKEVPVVVVDFKDKATGRTEDRWCVLEFKLLKGFLDGSVDNR